MKKIVVLLASASLLSSAFVFAQENDVELDTDTESAPVSVDLKVNNSDGPLSYQKSFFGTRLSVTWTSENALECEADWTSRHIRTHGKQNGRTRSSRIFTITCTGENDETASDSVEVTIFTKPEKPAIISLNPSSGQSGTEVTISGSNFTATGNTVSFSCPLPDGSSSGWGHPNASSDDGKTLTTVVSSPAIPVDMTLENITKCTGHVSNANGVSNEADFSLITPKKENGKPLVCGNLGDANADGRISSADADLIRSFVLAEATPSATQKKNSDVNGDGAVTTADLHYILLYFNGYSNTFPGCASEEPPISNQLPVIKSVDGPTSVVTGQSNTWTVHAGDAESGTLHYSFNVHDRAEDGDWIQASSSVDRRVTADVSEAVSFNHAFSFAGEYVLVFRVADAQGKNTGKHLVVQVSSSSPAVVVSCTDSDGGKNLNVAGLTDNRVNGIGSFWNDASVDANGGSCSGTECTSVREGFCTADGRVDTQLIACPSGYSVNGACAPKPGTQPSITVLSPNGGESFTLGSPVSIRWSGGDFGDSAAVSLYTFLSVVEESRPGYPMFIGQARSSSYSFNWDGKTVCTGIGPEGVCQGASSLQPGSYRIIVQSRDLIDKSDSSFTITAPTTSANQPPVIKLVDGPTSVVAGESNTWTMYAGDPDGTYLAYAVHSWGDGTSGPGGDTSTTGAGVSKAITFSHTYATAGMRTITFKVVDGNDLNALGAMTTRTVTVTAPTSSQPPASDSLSFSLVSTTEDKTSGYGFTPGNGPDWGYTAAFNLSSAKTIKSMEISAGPEVWSTSNRGFYNLLVFDGGNQLNTAYGQTFSVPAGVKTFKLYAQKWFQDFNSAYKLTVTFTDGTSLSATVGTSQSRLERLYASIRASQAASAYLGRLFEQSEF